MRRLIIGVAIVGFSFIALADAVSVTVPANVDATLDEAIAAGYMSGAADYAGLLAATDLVVNGAGRLIIDKNLKADGYSGEVHVSAGSRLQLRVSGALGDTAHGTFVADGATLETWTDGSADTLNFLGEPLSFAGCGVDGCGALVSLTTANQQRKGAWGGTVLTMTGDALVRLNGAVGNNIDFPYQSAHASNSIDMNGHTLTFCGPGGRDYYTLPLRLNVTNPGHVVASNALLISMNENNNLGGSAANTFTIGNRTRLHLYNATNENAKTWTLVMTEDAPANTMYPSMSGGVWDGPINWPRGNDMFFAVASANENGNVTRLRGTVAVGNGMDVTNTTKGAAHDNYPQPRLRMEGSGNSVGGRLRVSDMEMTFDEPNPSLGGGLEIVNARMSVNAGCPGNIGLWKGTNQAYTSWNSSSDPQETRLRYDYTSNYKSISPDVWKYYTNSVALGPDDAMAATVPNYGKATLVTYRGYVWNNTGSQKRITFLTHVNGYMRISIQRNDTLAWNGPEVSAVDQSGGPTAILLKPGAHRISIVLALNNGKGGVNNALSGDYGIMYTLADAASTSTDPNDYLPFMDPGDGSLLTRTVPGTDEYEALGFGGENPIELAPAVTGSGGATLSLNGGNYSVGSVTGALIVINEELPRTTNVAFTVMDTLCCRASDLQIGEHLVVTGALKFAEGATLSVTGLKSLPEDGTYVVAESDGGITGLPVPDLGTSKKKASVYMSGDGEKIMVRITATGTMLILR